MSKLGRFCELGEDEDMNVQDMMADAKKEAETIPTPAPITIEDYVAKMVAAEPKSVVTFDQPFNHETLIPGLGMSLGKAKVYEITWEMIGVLQEVKSKYFHPHVVSTLEGHFIVRGMSRQEWADLQTRIIKDAKERIQGHISNNSDPQAAEQDVEMRNEEMIAVAGLVWPNDYNKMSIRTLPSGTVSQIADAVLVATGHNANPLPPLKL